MPNKNFVQINIATDVPESVERVAIGLTVQETDPGKRVYDHKWTIANCQTRASGYVSARDEVSISSSSLTRQSPQGASRARP